MITIEGNDIAVTNPDKVLWPDLAITKIMYLERIAALAPYLLKHCANRYMTTIRYPNGIRGKSFYQKNCPEPTPPFVKTSPLNDVNYVNMDSLSTLVWLGNLACLEFHPSFHYIDDLLPAEWVIDIDPTLEVEPRIMEAASLVGELLQSLGIQSVPKTSGATGVQIVIPIPKGRYTFAQLRTMGQFIATFLVEKYPELFTVERLKKDRGTRIYVDYLQHWHGKSLSAPYTPRARAGATVSTPLTWDEVARNPVPGDFTLLNIEQRLKHTGDLLTAVAPQSLDHILAALPD